MAVRQENATHAVRRRPVAFALWAWWALAFSFAVLAAFASLYDRFPGDEAITDAFQDVDVPALGGYLEFVNTIGDGWLFVALVLACAVALFALGAGWYGVLVLGAIVARSANSVLKDWVDRPRPSADLVEVHERVSSFSFPSGHTVGTAVLFALLLIALPAVVASRPLRWLLQAGCLLFIVSAGPARVYDGVHWPSDVLGGYLLAVLFLLPLFFVYRSLTTPSGTWSPSHERARLAPKSRYCSGESKPPKEGSRHAPPPAAQHRVTRRPRGGAVNWLDAVIVLVALWFTYAAFQAGFIREIVTVVAAVLGVVLAGLFYEELADDVLTFIDNDRLANIVAFGALFGATALAGQMLALVLKPTVSMLQLGIFDQMIGAIFGFAKAFVFIEIFLIVFITFPRWGLDEDIEDSTFGSWLVDRTPILVNILPDEFEGAVDDFQAQI